MSITGTTAGIPPIFPLFSVLPAHTASSLTAARLVLQRTESETHIERDYAELVIEGAAHEVPDPHMVWFMVLAAAVILGGGRGSLAKS